MKILHLLDIPWWSGLSAYAFDCIEAQIALGHEVSLACQKNTLPFRKAKESSIQTIAIAGRQSWKAPINFILIGIIVLRLKPNYIIAHTGSTHWVALWWGSQTGIPVIRVRASSPSTRNFYFNAKLYLNTYRIITASEKLKTACLMTLGNELKERISILYPPMDINALPQITNGVKPIKIGLLARLDPVKGHSNFLKAAKIVQDKFPGTEFHLAGPEENIKWHSLLKEAKNIGIQKIFYHGFLAQEKVLKFISDCSIGIIASTGSEEVSRALLEWISLGKPVVASSVGCIPEILKHGEGGYIVSSKNSVLMAERIIELISQPELIKKMGDFNKEFCKNNFSIDRFQSKWEKILKQ